MLQVSSSGDCNCRSEIRHLRRELVKRHPLSHSVHGWQDGRVYRSAVTQRWEIHLVFNETHLARQLFTCRVRLH
jgi:hypothetical protein